MKIHYSNYEVILTPKQKLLKNRTIQWFLYGDPDYFDNVVVRFLNKQIEQRMNNAFLYGTSHPEMYDLGDADQFPMDGNG